MDTGLSWSDLGLVFVSHLLQEFNVLGAVGVRIVRTKK